MALKKGVDRLKGKAYYFNIRTPCILYYEIELLKRGIAMGKKWNIVCDSSGELSSAELIPGKLGLKVIPMTLLVGEREYVDNENLDVEELLQAMDASETSGTACPSPAAFAEAFMEADYTLCFTISSNLSGTYASAVAARSMVLEQYPEKKIFVLDSCSTSGSLVLLTRKTVELLESGNEDFDDICSQLQTCVAHQYTLFTLECFDNLVKNGRMKPLLGSFLQTLGIHVIADASPEGTIRVVDKARGEKRTFRNMVSQMEKFKNCAGAEVIISHCKNLEGAKKLKEQILQSMPVKSVEIFDCRGLTTFYAMKRGLILVM